MGYIRKAISKESQMIEKFQTNFFIKHSRKVGIQQAKPSYSKKYRLTE